MPREVPGFQTAGAALLIGMTKAGIGERIFADYPAPLRAAVEAYDDARRGHHGSIEPPMSDANKATLAPMIAAAVAAYVDAIARDAA